MTQIPFVKGFEFEVGRADRVAPKIRRIVANNPGPFTFTGTGVYLVGEKEVAVIDPGPEDKAHLGALERAAGAGAITHILITHTHRDHCAGARALAERTGARIFGFGPHPVRERRLDAPALDEGGDYAFTPDAALKDGDALETREWRLEAIHTPGHLSNHLCFALDDGAALFTGDHVMGWATTVIAPPDGDMDDYMKSLERLIARDDALLLPTHGAPIETPRPFLRAIRTHRLMRDAQIKAALAEKPRTIAEIVARLYADIDKRLHGAAALNVLAHLIRLEKRGDAARDDADAPMAALWRRAGA